MAKISSLMWVAENTVGTIKASRLGVALTNETWPRCRPTQRDSHKPLGGVINTVQVCQILEPVQSPACWFARYQLYLLFFFLYIEFHSFCSIKDPCFDV